jgi:putative transposase
MPRQPRVEYEGAVYHVMSRGNDRKRIYFDREAHLLFLDTLDEACGKTGWRIHAYVLMPNHYHLLLGTPQANLVAGMQWLQGTFTSRVNARYKRRGHLFQGRYKALLIDGEDGDGNYFRTVGDYIHLNPARGGLLRKKKSETATGRKDREPLWRYPWSSYPLYRQWKNKRPSWLVAESVLGEHRLKDNTRGRNAYSEYLEERAIERGLRRNEEWSPIRRGWCLGGEAFREKMLDKAEEVLGGKRPESFSGELKAGHDERQAERIVRRALAALGVKHSDLEELKKGAVEKQGIAWLIRSRTTMGTDWVARRLQMGHPSSVTAAVRKVRAGATPRLKKIKKTLEEIRVFQD